MSLEQLLVEISLTTHGIRANNHPHTLFFVLLVNVFRALTIVYHLVRYWNLQNAGEFDIEILLSSICFMTLSSITVLHLNRKMRKLVSSLWKLPEKSKTIFWLYLCFCSSIVHFTVLSVAISKILTQRLPVQREHYPLTSVIESDAVIFFFHVLWNWYFSTFGFYCMSLLIAFLPKIRKANLLLQKSFKTATPAYIRKELALRSEINERLHSAFEIVVLFSSIITFVAAVRFLFNTSNKPLLFIFRIVEGTFELVILSILLFVYHSFRSQELNLVYDMRDYIEDHMEESIAETDQIFASLKKMETLELTAWGFFVPDKRFLIDFILTFTSVCSTLYAIYR